MYRKGLLVGLLAGAMTVVALLIVFSAGETMPRAMAQPPAAPAAPASSPRYQIATWAHPAAFSSSGSPSSAASHGAYVLDTWSGEVWLIEETRRPSKIEGIGKVRPE